MTNAAESLSSIARSLIRYLQKQILKMNKLSFLTHVLAYFVFLIDESELKKNPLYNRRCYNNKELYNYADPRYA